MSTSPRAAAGWVARSYAALVVTLRYVVLLGWGVGLAAAVLYLPALQPSNGGLQNVVPSNAPAVRAELNATRLFGEPLDAPVAVVQRDGAGLPTAAAAGAIRHAVAVDTGHGSTPIAGLAGTLPVSNAAGLFPGSRERSTTVVTFLYFRPDASIALQTAGGQRYAAHYAGAPADHLVGVTGVSPATYQQGVLIGQRLPWVEVATVLAIAVIVGLYFGSFGAPIATLLCAGVAYEVAVRLVAWLVRLMHVPLPPDVEPVLVVLLLGVTTDYTVFFMSGMRTRLAEGLPRVQAARVTTAEFSPIILAAGLLVTAGTAALSVAHMQLIRAFGPALAITVLTSMVVSMTLGPALIATFGSLLFRPGPAWFRRALASVAGRADAADAAEGGPADAATGGPADAATCGPADAATCGAAGTAGRADAAGTAEGGAVGAPRRSWQLRERVARFATARPLALLLAVACLAGLLGVAWAGRAVKLGSPLITELPASSTAVRAQHAAGQGFAPGILSPTEILVIGPGVTSRGAALGRLQRELARQPGVAGVVGPANLPAVARSVNPMLAKSGDAARFGVIEQTDPLGPAAVSRVGALERSLPRLARSAGLHGVRLEVGGETAAIGDAISATTANLGELALIMLGIMFVLLALFLRALLAPVYLLATSVLALLATLGICVWVFQHELGYGGLVYYVPFTVAVLLISLGSDYNVFVVGRIWAEARRRPLRDAIAIAGSQASRAITVAGLALATSFAMLALIPLEQFREIALGMAVGIMVDAVIVRSLLVPALVALFGRAGMWPGSRRMRVAEAPPTAGTLPDMSRRSSRPAHCPTRVMNDSRGDLVP
jgi:putative drug exporter of the RND superfamily